MGFFGTTKLLPAAISRLLLDKAPPSGDMNRDAAVRAGADVLPLLMADVTAPIIAASLFGQNSSLGKYFSSHEGRNVSDLASGIRRLARIVHAHATEKPPGSIKPLLISLAPDYARGSEENLTMARATAFLLSHSYTALKDVRLEETRSWLLSPSAPPLPGLQDPSPLLLSMKNAHLWSPMAYYSMAVLADLMEQGVLLAPQYYPKNIRRLVLGSHQDSGFRFTRREEEFLVHDVEGMFSTWMEHPMDEYVAKGKSLFPNDLVGEARKAVTSLGETSLYSVDLIEAQMRENPRERRSIALIYELVEKGIGAENVFYIEPVEERHRALDILITGSSESVSLSSALRGGRRAFGNFRGKGIDMESMVLVDDTRLGNFLFLGQVPFSAHLHTGGLVDVFARDATPSMSQLLVFSDSKSDRLVHISLWNQEKKRLFFLGYQGKNKGRMFGLIGRARVEFDEVSSTLERIYGVQGSMIENHEFTERYEKAPEFTDDLGNPELGPAVVEALWSLRMVAHGVRPDRLAAFGSLFADPETIGNEIMSRLSLGGTSTLGSKFIEEEEEDTTSTLSSPPPTAVSPS